MLTKTSLDEIKESLEGLYRYKKQEKPARQAQEVTLEGLKVKKRPCHIFCVPVKGSVYW